MFYFPACRVVGFHHRSQISAASGQTPQMEVWPSNKSKQCMKAKLNLEIYGLITT
jgi:hypothetical protein